MSDIQTKYTCGALVCMDKVYNDLEEAVSALWAVVDAARTVLHGNEAPEEAQALRFMARTITAEIGDFGDWIQKFKREPDWFNLRPIQEDEDAKKESETSAPS